MKILIIGSKGFIGSATNQSLEKRYDVFTCDTLITNSPKYFQITKQIRFKDIFKNYNFDICINCAGSANVQESFTTPLNDFNLNVKLVVELLDAIRTHNPNCKLINISSAAVYGNPTKLPVDVTDKLNPVSPYGIHKMLADEIMHYYYNVFGLLTCSLRVFSVYGEGQKKLLFWDLFNKIQSEKDLIILSGSGQESRDYIYIDDLIQQIELTIKNTKFHGESINIANGSEVKIIEIVDLFSKYHPKKFNYQFNGLSRIGDPVNWCANIDDMIRWGYKRKVNLNEGVKRYINWALNEK